jgi:hypothetical protein
VADSVGGPNSHAGRSVTMCEVYYMVTTREHKRRLHGPDSDSAQETKGPNPFMPHDVELYKRWCRDTSAHHIARSSVGN